MNRAWSTLSSQACRHQRWTDKSALLLGITTNRDTCCWSLADWPAQWSIIGTNVAGCCHRIVSVGTLLTHTVRPLSVLCYLISQEFFFFFSLAAVVKCKFTPNECCFSKGYYYQYYQLLLTALFSRHAMLWQPHFAMSGWSYGCW